MRSVRCLLLCVLFAGFAVAQQPTADEVRQAWNRSRAVNPEFPPLDGGASPAEKVVARHAFHELFRRSDWSAFDSKSDHDLLRSGLWRAGYHGLNSGDGELAQRAFRTYLGRLPESSSCRRIRRELRPKALVLAGRTEKAIAMLEEAVAAEAKASETMRALIVLGDARFAAGHREPAIAEWKRALEVPPDEKHFAWNMVDLHPIVVVGRDGKSVFAQVSGGEISSVHAVVSRLLAEK
jgi:tetratricopeptide (TPR) repeat protein